MLPAALLSLNCIILLYTLQQKGNAKYILTKGRATFLFARDIRDLSMTPETCQEYNIVVLVVSARYTVSKL